VELAVGLVLVRGEEEEFSKANPESTERIRQIRGHHQYISDFGEMEGRSSGAAGGKEGDGGRPLNVDHRMRYQCRGGSQPDSLSSHLGC
jgi:hypothetical protein